MAATVKIPGIGAVDKKYAYAGVAVIAGIAGYAYWNAQRVAAADVPVEADYTDEVPTDDYAVDDYGYSGSTPGYVNPGGTDYPPYVDQNPLPTTNAEWAQAALIALTDVGVDPLAASAAIGKYLARLAMSSAQADYIRQANALVGVPPVGTFNIEIEQAPPVVPPPGDGNNNPPVTLRAPTGLKTWGNGPSRLTVPLMWGAVPGAVQGYRIYRSDVSYNVGASQDTQVTIGGLTPNKSYKFRVRAIGAGGALGPPSAWFTATTKK